MIYITGDCHSDFRRFSKEVFPEQQGMAKDDFVIVCGDFGGVWDPGGESKEERWWMDWLEAKRYTTLFVDGNHENFDRLCAYPVEEWSGGKVHRIRSSVMHLMRGQVFSLDGKKIFTFGGARSHDIGGGILEREDPFFKRKKSQLDKAKKGYRINHVSWWKEEMPSGEEMEEGLANLEAHGNEVDYIVTHCCASATQRLLGVSFEEDEETAYLDRIRQNCRYRKWFFGHYHDNRNVTDREILLYEQIIRIS